MLQDDIWELPDEPVTVNASEFSMYEIESAAVRDGNILHVATSHFGRQHAITFYLGRGAFLKSIYDDEDILLAHEMAKIKFERLGRNFYFSRANCA